MNIWRMNIKTSNKNAFEFCRGNNILGIGWPLDKLPKDQEEAEKLGRERYRKARGYITAIRVLYRMQINDLVWTRDNNNVYYLCRVLSDVKHSEKEENIKYDVCHYVDVDFIKIGGQENVPGIVVNNFRAPNSTSIINHEDIGIESLIKTIYNDNTKTEFRYETEEITNFWNMLLPEDVELVVSLYLQKELDYMIYPNTNQKDTKKYEFTMVNRNDNSKACVQVKTGKVILDKNEFKELAKNYTVYLFTTYDKYIGEGENIIIIDKAKLTKFVLDNECIMPQQIKSWIKYLK
ncbi:MAG: hypothetical protein E7311_04315 [Clostridiales bacterium]|nr:hypothetical protein [Clostridiales bacterium]